MAPFPPGSKEFGIGQSLDLRSVQVFWILRAMQRLETTTEVADALGRAVIAQRVGVGLTTVSAAVTEGVFPASWYRELQNLGAERAVEIPDSLFRFKGSTVSAA